MATTQPHHPPLNVESRLVKLQECINKGHIKASIQLCDSLLKTVPGTDSLYDTLLRNKVRLMIQGKQFSSVIHFSKTVSSDKLAYIKQEVAYAHYRMGNYMQALECIKNIDAVLLKAQILYRLDFFEEAIKEYELLSNSTSDSLTLEEVSVNLSACKAAFALSGGDLPSTSQDHTSVLPEYIYNQATLSIGRKEFSAAKGCLKQAIEICDDDLIKAQLKYQLVYCDHHLGLPICLPELGQDKLINSLILILNENCPPKKLVSTIQSLMPKYASYQKSIMKFNLATLHYELGNIAKAKSIAKTLTGDKYLRDMVTDLLTRIDGKK